MRKLAPSCRVGKRTWADVPDRLRPRPVALTLKAAAFGLNAGMVLTKVFAISGKLFTTCDENVCVQLPKKELNRFRDDWKLAGVPRGRCKLPLALSTERL